MSSSPPQGPPVQVTPYFHRNWLLFSLVGAINNFPYLLILAAAKSLAQSFGEEENYGALGWGLTCLCFFSQYICTLMLRYRVPHWLRILGNAVALVSGLFLIATAPNFWVVVAGAMLIGAQCTFGEINWLGYMSLFDPLLISAWGFGTGVAGVSSTGLYLLLHGGARIPNSTIFWVMIPMGLIYFGAFFWMKPLYTKDKCSEGKTGFLDQKASDFWVSIRLTLWVGCNVTAVFFMEYFSYSKFARDSTAQSQAQAQASMSDGMLWVMCNGYEILQLCYQVGVLVSRSSLPLYLRIPFLSSHTGIMWLTLGQLVCLVYWGFAAATQGFSMYLNLAMMFVVGLFGGSMYVLSCYRVQTDDQRYPQDQKEMCVVTYHFYITLGLAGQFIATLVLDKTVWPPADNQGCVAFYGVG